LTFLQPIFLGSLGPDQAGHLTKALGLAIKTGD